MIISKGLFDLGSFQKGIRECYKNTASLIGCNGGSKYVPADILTGPDQITTVSVVNGTITIKEESKTTIYLPYLDKYGVVAWTIKTLKDGVEVMTVPPAPYSGVEQIINGFSAQVIK